MLGFRGQSGLSWQLVDFVQITLCCESAGSESKERKREMNIIKLIDSRSDLGKVRISLKVTMVMSS